MHRGSCASWEAIAVVAVVLSAATAPPAQAQHHDHRGTGPDLGDVVRFETTCRPTVAAVLDRGVHQLHTFAFDDSIGNFRLAAHSDVDCALAYWGTAMAHWGRFVRTGQAGALAEGWRALDQAALLRREPSGRERRYLDALQLRYRERSGDGPSRYAAAMVTLADDHPEDVHARLFAAVALLDRPAASAADALSRHRRALEMCGQPPAVGSATLHCLVLAGDHPRLAGQVLPAARTLAGSGGASAALINRSSHILMRLGLWEEAIAANLRAADAAVVAGTPGDELHALDALAFAQLRLGRVEAGIAIARRIAGGHLAGVAGDDAAFERSAILARVAIETGDPGVVASTIDAARTDAWTGAPLRLAATVLAAERGDADAAADHAAALADLPIPAKRRPALAPLTTVARAWSEFAGGRFDAALDMVHAAVELEAAADDGAEWATPVTPARTHLSRMRQFRRSGSRGRAAWPPRPPFATDSLELPRCPSLPSSAPEQRDAFNGAGGRRPDGPFG